MSDAAPASSDLEDDLLETAHFDLLRLPILGRFLSWRHARTLLQIPLLLVSVIMILHGLFGPSSRA